MYLQYDSIDTQYQKSVSHPVCSDWRISAHRHDDRWLYQLVVGWLVLILIFA